MDSRGQVVIATVTCNLELLEKRSKVPFSPTANHLLQNAFCSTSGRTASYPETVHAENAAQGSAAIRFYGAIRKSWWRLQPMRGPCVVSHVHGLVRESYQTCLEPPRVKRKISSGSSPQHTNSSEVLQCEMCVCLLLHAFPAGCWLLVGCPLWRTVLSFLQGLIDQHLILSFNIRRIFFG